MNHRVRRIAPDGTISTFAGIGVSGFSGDGGPAAAAQFSFPAQTLFDSAGNLYISDYANGRVRVVSPAGIISTVAGNGVPDPPAFSYTQVGDGGPALDALLTTVTSAAFGPSGELYVADAYGYRIRKIAPDGTITTIAGTGEVGYSGDGGPAIQAEIYYPITLAVDRSGTVYFHGLDSRVRKVTPDGIIHLVAGTGTGTGPIRSGGDGGPAVDGPPLLANLQGSGYYAPSSIAFDANGDMFIPSGPRIREVIPGLVTAQLSKDRIDFQGASPPAQSIRVATNIAEPMAFAVSGGAWLSTNRPTGQTGDLLTISANPAGLTPGAYSATIQISIPGGAVGASLPVTLTVQ
jgi:hypothetical protein